MPPTSLRSFALGLAWALLALPGCGYTFQTSQSHALENEGIRRVYVAPLVNDTFKAGVENVVYNALVRTLAASRRVKLVQKEVDADAVLAGRVLTAQSASSGAMTTADKLNPVGLGRPDVQVTTEYNATLICLFILRRRVAVPRKRDPVWSASFSRTRPFPAANQLGPPGTTTALINDSEFDRALSDLASSMMADVQESMLAMF